MDSTLPLKSPSAELKLMPVSTINTTTKASGKWLKFNEVQFKDPIYGEKRSWEYVRRSGNVEGQVDAIEVVGIVKRRNQFDTIVLVTQYRPPTSLYCVEFPAGLVDKNEDPEDAAKRELKEETGYTFKKILKRTPTLFYEPGLSNSSMKMIYVEKIDGDAPENDPPVPKLEHDEWGLQTIELPINSLYDELERIHKEKGVAIDAKLYTFAYGLKLSEAISLSHQI